MTARFTLGLCAGAALAALSIASTPSGARAQTAAAPPTGDRHVAYAVTPQLQSAYRLYVPVTWKPGDHWPLVVMLHGGGGDENSAFDRSRDPQFRDRMHALATQHRFILLAPRGHKGWWGARMLTAEDPAPIRRGVYRWPPAGAITAPPPKLTPLTDEDLALSEQGVFASMAEVARTYGTDPARVYLMGNSMGSIGVLHIAQDHPDRWCAIAPSDGPIDPATYPYERIKTVKAALFVHGEDDRTAPIESMRKIADGFTQAGVPTRFLAVPRGSHSESWREALATTFDFFDEHRCRAPAQ